MFYNFAALTVLLNQDNQSAATREIKLLRANIASKIEHAESLMQIYKQTEENRQRISRIVQETGCTAQRFHGYATDMVTIANTEPEQTSEAMSAAIDADQMHKEHDEAATLLHEINRDLRQYSEKLAVLQSEVEGMMVEYERKVAALTR